MFPCKQKVGDRALSNKQATPVRESSVIISVVQTGT